MDFLKHEKHVHTRDFIETNLDHQLLPTVTKPTRITMTSSTLIDNIFIGRKYQGGFKSNIGISDISDHLPIIVTLDNLNPYSKAAKPIITRKLDANKMDLMNERLNAEDWEGILHNKNTNESFNVFHKIVQKHLNDIAPLKTVKIPPKKLIRDDWMTPGLMKCTQKQRKLYKATLLDKKDEQKNMTYKTYRNTLTRILRKAKETYYQNKCKEYKRNTKRLWQMINRITNKTANKTTLIEYLKIDNLEIHNAKEISTEFAKYFSTIGKKYANLIDDTGTSIHTYINNIPNNPRTIYIRPTSKAELISLIHNLANKTSKGYDDITNVMLKRLHSSIVGPLSVIFNKSLAEGCFPDLMKYADVVPLYKSKEHYLTNNYRPISLLITVSKLLEKVMYKRTYDFLMETNQLYAGQYGFRKQHSCENAICELTSEVLKNFEHKKPTVGISLDLSKAFDTLSHNILLKKMNKYGIRGISSQWFNSYLTERQLRTKCNTQYDGTQYSDYFPIEYGTPQGSCLGPLLFLIFTNDLYLCIENGSCLLFADDTSLYYSHTNIRYLKWCITQDLNRIMDWFKANKLTLNINKTECIYFSNKPTSNFEIDIGETRIKSTDSAKILGIWLDTKLSWKKHTNTLLMKIKQNTNLIQISNKFLNKYCKKNIYYAHIYSHITYGLSLWGNMVDTAIKTKIQKVMNKCFNLITHQNPTPENFNKEGLLILNQLITLENQKLGYKLYNNMLPINIQTAISTDSKKKDLLKSHRYDTRNKLKLNLPVATNKLYHASFLIQALKAYDMLPKEISLCSNMRNFVSKCKVKLLQQK